MPLLPLLMPCTIEGTSYDIKYAYVYIYIYMYTYIYIYINIYMYTYTHASVSGCLSHKKRKSAYSPPAVLPMISVCLYVCMQT